MFSSCHSSSKLSIEIWAIWAKPPYFWLVSESKGGKIWIARLQIEISVHSSSMVCTKQTPRIQKESGHLLLARMPAPSSSSGSGSQGPLAGRWKQSTPRKNLAHVKQDTRVWEQVCLLQGYSRHATNFCISKMRFARQVFFNLFIIYVFFFISILYFILLVNWVPWYYYIYVIYIFNLLF